MRTEDIIRAWKDEAFRQSLDTNQQARLPEHPVGLVELQDDDLTNADGGSTFLICTYSIIVSIATISAAATLHFSCDVRVCDY